MKSAELDQFALLSSIDEELVLDAIPPAGFGAAAPRRKRAARAYDRFMSSGLVAAVLSILVAGGILTAIVLTNRQATPPPPASGVSDTDILTGTEIEPYPVTEADIAGKIFIYEHSLSPVPFAISMMEDGRMTYYEAAHSSHVGIGEWTLSDGILTITEVGYEGRTRINRFAASEDGLTFLADGSDNFIYIKVADGERFRVATEEDSGIIVFEPVTETESITETEFETIDPSICVHAFGEWEMNDLRDAHVRTCSLCGGKQEGKHQYGSWKYMDEQFHIEACIYCGISWLGQHDWQPYEGADGKSYLHCSICNTKKESSVIEAGCGHWFSEWEAVRDASLHTRNCRLCGKIEEEAHRYDEWIYLDENLHRQSCADCGLSFDVNHDWQPYESPDGSWVGKRCTGCNARREEGETALETALRAAADQILYEEFPSLAGIAIASFDYNSWPIRDEADTYRVVYTLLLGGIHTSETYYMNLQGTDHTFHVVSANASEAGTYSRYYAACTLERMADACGELSALSGDTVAVGQCYYEIGDTGELILCYEQIVDLVPPPDAEDQQGCDIDHRHVFHRVTLCSPN